MRLPQWKKFSCSVLIEKILRTEPDVGKIYLLIKAKNQEAAMERLKNEVCFISEYSRLLLSCILGLK